MILITFYVIGNEIYEMNEYSSKNVGKNISQLTKRKQKNLEKGTNKSFGPIPIIQKVIEIIIILFCLIIAIVPEGAEIAFSVCILVYSH